MIYALFSSKRVHDRAAQKLCYWRLVRYALWSICLLLWQQQRTSFSLNDTLPVVEWISLSVRSLFRSKWACNPFRFNCYCYHQYVPYGWTEEPWASIQSLLLSSVTHDRTPGCCGDRVLECVVLRSVKWTLRVRKLRKLVSPRERQAHFGLPRQWSTYVTALPWHMLPLQVFPWRPDHAHQLDELGVPVSSTLQCVNEWLFDYRAIIVVIYRSTI